VVKIVSYSEAFSLVSPWYNLSMILIGLYLFRTLSKIKNKNVDLTPWKFVFFALGIGLVEEILIILRSAQLINIPLHINGFFEIIIVSFLLYTLLLKRKSLK